MKFLRPICVTLIVCSMLVDGCTNGGSHLKKSVIRLHIGQHLREVQAESQYMFSENFLDCKNGGEFITVPHTLIYQDDDFNFQVEGAGALESLPTSIGCSIRLTHADPDSVVENITVFVLPGYGSLSAAIKRASKIKNEFLAQGFIQNERTPMSRFTAILKNAPASLDSLEDVESAFLSSAFFAQSVTVLDMSKQKIHLELTLTNARRKWGARSGGQTMEFLDAPETRALKEARDMNEKDLIAEESYSLKLSIGPESTSAERASGGRVFDF